MENRPGFVISFIGLAAALALPLAAGALGSTFNATSIDTWYVTLTKPALNPPNWVFPVVWTTLYAAMGLASWLVWRAAGSIGRAAFPLGVYAVHLVLNVGWSFLFFGQQNPPAALIEIYVLLASIVLTALLFLRWSRIAALLFVPYIAWVSFATYLNFSIVVLNY